jgi:hypothetical protein
MRKPCLLIFLAASFAFAQVPVTMAPPLHFQFFDANGVALANGKLYTYAAGTTNLQNTYADAGGVNQNSDPIMLDATGSPSNGSVQTGIFLANLSYKFVAFNQFNVFEWSVDNVSTYFGLLNTANLWTAAQSFDDPITLFPSDNQIVFGSPGSQTTFDIPPGISNYVLHFPPLSASDTAVTQAATQTLTNKSFTSPTVNGCEVSNSPGTYICPANGAAGTTYNGLAKFTGAPSTVVATTTSDTQGIQGVCVNKCGTSGNAVIQQSGIALCVFDNATTAGDYVINSPFGTSNCRDSGIAPPGSLPVGTQSVGIVLSTNASNGTYDLALELGAGGGSSEKLVCQNVTSVTVDTATVENQLIQNCSVPTELNAVGKVFRVSTAISVVPSSSGSWAGFSIGGTSTAYFTVISAASVTANYYVNIEAVCQVTAAGASPAFSCTGIVTDSIISGSPTLTILFSGPYTSTGGNLTGSSITVSNYCSFESASSSNFCIASTLMVEELN